MKKVKFLKIKSLLLAILILLSTTSTTSMIFGIDEDIHNANCKFDCEHIYIPSNSDEILSISDTTEAINIKLREILQTTRPELTDIEIDSTIQDLWQNRVEIDATDSNRIQDVLPNIPDFTDADIQYIFSSEENLTESSIQDILSNIPGFTYHGIQDIFKDQADLSSNESTILSSRCPPHFTGTGILYAIKNGDIEEWYFQVDCAYCGLLIELRHIGSVGSHS